MGDNFVVYDKGEPRPPDSCFEIVRTTVADGLPGGVFHQVCSLPPGHDGPHEAPYGA